MNTADRTIGREETAELSFLEALLKRRPDDIEILKAAGDLYTRAGKFEAGLKADLRVVSADEADETAWYNLACSYSLLDRTDSAFEALGKAVALGFDDFGWMNRDPDLEPIRSDSRFKELVSG